MELSNKEVLLASPLYKLREWIRRKIFNLRLREPLPILPERLPTFSELPEKYRKLLEDAKKSGEFEPFEDSLAVLAVVMAAAKADLLVANCT